MELKYEDVLTEVLPFINNVPSKKYMSSTYGYSALPLLLEFNKELKTQDYHYIPLKFELDARTAYQVDVNITLNEVEIDYTAQFFFSDNSGKYINLKGTYKGLLFEDAGVLDFKETEKAFSEVFSQCQTTNPDHIY